MEVDNLIAPSCVGIAIVPGRAERRDAWGDQVVNFHKPRLNDGLRAATKPTCVGYGLVRLRGHRPAQGVPERRALSLQPLVLQRRSRSEEGTVLPASPADYGWAQ